MNRFFSKAALFIFACSFLMSSAVFAGDASLGVGISATNKGATIYLPIRMKHLMFEPMISYSSEESQDESNYGYIDQNDYKREYSIGLGVFLLKDIFSIADILVGMRGAYIDFEQEYREYGYLTDYSHGSNLTADGFMIAPTLGVEYHINDHISAGIYTAIEYVKLTGDKKSYNSDYGEHHLDYERKTKSTATDLYVKYYF